MVIFDTLENGLRRGGQEDDAAVLFHFGDIAIPHRDTASAGNDCVLSGLHLDQEIGLAVAEVFLSMDLEDIRNRHSLASCDDLIHFDTVHSEHGAEVIGHGSLSGAHKSDQHQIIAEELSGLNPLAVLVDALKYGDDLFAVALTLEAALQPDPLALLLLGLKDREIVLLCSHCQRRAGLGPGSLYYCQVGSFGFTPL